MAVRYIGTDFDGVDVDANSDLWVLREGFTLSNVADAFDFLGFFSATLVIDGTIYSQTDAVDSDAGSSGNTVNVGATGSVLGDSDGIEMGGVNHEVFNYGEVTGLNDRAIQMIGDGGKILNAGTAYGQSDGISMEGDNNLLTNTGLIAGEFDGVNLDGTGSKVYNSGEITGDRNGFEFNTLAGEVNTLENAGIIATTGVSGDGVRGDFGDETVINSGTILGDVVLGAGMDIFDGRGGFVSGWVDGGADNDVFIIDDTNARLYEAPGGGVDTVESQADFALGDFIENLTLLGASDIDGTGNSSRNIMAGNVGDNDLSGEGSRDTIDGGMGDDTVDGGRGDDVLDGDAGNDVLLGRSGVDIMDGGEGDDLLAGGLGDDIMNGNDGDDTLKGGEGADTMTGGAGQDNFVFTRVSDSDGSGSDVITDFTPGQDVLDFSGMLTGQFDLSILGSYSGTGPSIRTYVNTSGDTVVFADTNGDGVTDMRIELDNVTGVTESDFLL
ncbi:MAG: hypothetical protein CMH12_21240 [Maritimibacter sp.]|mgnify:CR=1 FL=1|nr:hypothetical protein [Maritimibacter sp.]